MSNFWLPKFDELAKFNADKDKTKYSNEYLKKMKRMQFEYDERRISWARASGHIIV